MSDFVREGRLLRVVGYKPWPPDFPVESGTIGC